MDAAWAGRRVYGTGPGDPDRGPVPRRVHAELTGGPLDGHLLDVTDWEPQHLAAGALLFSDHGAFGPGGRRDYEPDEEAAVGSLAVGVRCAGAVVTVVAVSWGTWRGAA
ncbi:hypothetical protein [Streptomyces vinaceus]|uniref:hypothetical protein n=1 Tax=Streptomyces vinaceus TaxID=1960 RepID=UPI003692D6AC